MLLGPWPFGMAKYPYWLGLLQLSPLVATLREHTFSPWPYQKLMRQFGLVMHDTQQSYSLTSSVVTDPSSLAIEESSGPAPPIP